MTVKTLKAWTNPEPVEAMILYPGSLMRIAEWIGANKLTTEHKFADGSELVMFWKDDEVVALAPIDKSDPVLIVKNLISNKFYYATAEEWATTFQREAD